MSTFNTIHVFGFGKIQVVKENGGTLDSSAVTSLAAFVDHIKTFKPAGVTLTDYHVIHIFNNFDIKYLGKNDGNFKVKNQFSVKLSEVDATIYNNFVNEVISMLPA
jgi:hypothetical protein